MVSKMEKKLRRKLDITKVRKQQKSVKHVKALVGLNSQNVSTYLHAFFSKNFCEIRFESSSITITSN